MLVLAWHLRGGQGAGWDITLVPRTSLVLEELPLLNQSLHLGRVSLMSKSRLLLWFDFQSLLDLMDMHRRMGASPLVTKADLLLHCVNFTDGAQYVLVVFFCFVLFK